LNKELRNAEQISASLAGRELPGDTVQQITNLTMGQLFYILGHIQKLSAQAPVTAQALLAENPQICYALLHAECLAGMVDKPLLPMSNEELHKAKLKARQIQEEIADHELPPPGQDRVIGGSAKSAGLPPRSGMNIKMEAGARSGMNIKMEAGASHPMASIASRVKTEGLAVPPPPPSGPSFAKSSQAPPPTASSTASASPVAGLDTKDAEQKQVLMNRLLQLTPDQIARLPEDTKVQVLKFLQQSQRA
jgi:hypothetical protein